MNGQALLLLVMVAIIFIALALSIFAKKDSNKIVGVVSLILGICPMVLLFLIFSA